MDFRLGNNPTSEKNIPSLEKIFEMGIIFSSLWLYLTDSITFTVHFPCDAPWNFH